MVRSRSVAIDALAGPESANPFARTPMAAVQNGGLRVEPLLAEVPLTVLSFRCLSQGRGTIGALVPNSNENARPHAFAHQSCRALWQPRACLSGGTRISVAGGDRGDLE
jgi:hypothetical protein